jgi:hypothetical protein
MDEFPFSALFLFAQSCLTDAVNVIFSDYCFTDTYLKGSPGHNCENCNILSPRYVRIALRYAGVFLSRRCFWTP